MEYLDGSVVNVGEREDFLLKMVKSVLGSPPESVADLYLFYDGFDHTKPPPVKRVVWDRDTKQAKLI
jgi:hypothetical protein